MLLVFVNQGTTVLLVLHLTHHLDFHRLEMALFVLQDTTVQRVLTFPFPVVLVPSITYLDRACVCNVLLDISAHQ